MVKKFLPREGEALHATTARAYSIRGYAHEAGEFDIAVVLVEDGKKNVLVAFRMPEGQILGFTVGTPLREQWQFLRAQVKTVTGVDVGAHPHTGD